MSETNQKVESSYWPYILPLVSFLALVELSNRTPESWQFAMLVARVIVPLSMLTYFWKRGDYPELKIRFSAMTVVDLLLGISLAGLWIAPYVWFPSLRPDSDSSPFDPAMAGAAMIPAVLSIRMIGYALITPVMEELFMRSFLIRFVEVFDDPDKDFREIAIGKFGGMSFAAVILVFLATHVPWEWYVMLPWAIITTLWLYLRKDLFALVVVHSATNAAILLSAIFLSGTFSDRSGGTLPLWFFV
ncbi:CPBP family glutamic-type intramembrane protease [Rubripirellula amarantea]|nr:CPBP family glutamic-type intramembrane protease [Rubripirellula amarantea]